MAVYCCSKIEMALQQNILAMFKKSNDRLGNPSHLDKQIQPGQLDGSKSRTGDPTESQSCTSNSKIGHINTVDDKISWPGHPIDDADASTKNVFFCSKKQQTEP